MTDSGSSIRRVLKLLKLVPEQDKKRIHRDRKCCLEYVRNIKGVEDL